MSKQSLEALAKYFDEAEYGGQPNPLIGNDTAKLTFPLMYFLSEQDCLIHGPAGGGKTTLLDGSIALFAGEKAFEDAAPGIVVASGGSGKSMITRTMEARLKKDRFFVMRELQTFLTESTNLEMFKTWMEGKPFIYGRNDAATDDTKTYNFWPPCIATTIADENEKAHKLGEELDRRFYRIEIRSDDELNQRVHRAKADIDALTPDKRFHLSSSDVQELRDHLQTASAKRYGKKPRNTNVLMKEKRDHSIKHFVNPCSPAVQTKIPTRSTRSNSMINYWFKAPKAVATYNWENTEGLFGDLMMVTPTDNYHAWQMCGQSIIYSSMGIDGTLGATLLDLLPSKSVYDEEVYGKDDGAHVDDIVRRMRLKADISKSVIVRNLGHLEMNGYVHSDDKKKHYWKHSSQEYDIGASWPAIMEETRAFMKENYPTHAKDYDVFLEDPVAEFWTKPNGDIVWETVKVLDVDTNIAKKDKAEMNENKKKVADLSTLDGLF